MEGNLEPGRQGRIGGEVELTKEKGGDGRSLSLMLDGKIDTAGRVAKGQEWGYQGKVGPRSILRG